MQPAGRRVAAPPTLAERYREVRGVTDRLVEGLEPEDCVVQSMPDVSPTKWHLAHVTWFFETFVLKPHVTSYRPRNPDFEFLFNSYYNSVGEQFPRPRRGLLSRPTTAEVRDYRADVDSAVHDLLEGSDRLKGDLLDLVDLGLHHEQQHQELILMDIKHVFSCNPLYPVYTERPSGRHGSAVPALEWVEHAEGVRAIGHDGSDFGFDNERPRHNVFVPGFALASRLVTNGEYLEFVEEGGYASPRCWLADGWTTVCSEKWSAPLYWVERDGAWFEFTLAGLRALDPCAPVCHVSYYEADAFASWKGLRLPSEAEWEIAASDRPVSGNLLESGRCHPAPTTSGSECGQLFGDVWEWTRSAYAPYPRFRKAHGAVGEYNGKFMCNQFVLRGGSCVTPRSHIRATYRNFFYPHQRWQFCGIRTARDA